MVAQKGHYSITGVFCLTDFCITDFQPNGFCRTDFHLTEFQFHMFSIILAFH